MKDYQVEWLKEIHRMKRLNPWDFETKYSKGEVRMLGLLFFTATKKCGEEDFHPMRRFEGCDLPGIRVSELARESDLPMPAVSRILASLEKKGVIERHADPEDRRSTFVYISEKGKQESDRINRVLNQFFGRVTERFGEEETRMYTELTHRLTTILEEEITAFRREMAEEPETE